MNRLVDPVYVPISWGELFDSIGQAISNDPRAPVSRALLLRHTRCHFGRHKGYVTGAKKRPWATGCIDGPIYVALHEGRNTEADLDQNCYGGAQLYCFVRVELSLRDLAHLISTPHPDPTAEFVDIDFAVVRLLEAHQSVTITDSQSRPVCPGLEINHTLWQEKVTYRSGTNTPSRLQQLSDAGLQVAQWKERYDTACFVALPTSKVAHYMNVGRDPDTGGLLQTINLTGYTGQQQW